MQSDSILVFDVEGEFGHFRKFNTTTSPLTYPIPPRTAIIGIIGAILGIERETGAGKYADDQLRLADILHTELAKIAVQLLHPVSKVNMAFNLINTNSKSSFFNIGNRTQIEYELLRRPKYRIFLQWKETEFSDRLQQLLINQETCFTVNLGLSQLLAHISYVGQFEITSVNSKDFIPVITAVKLSLLDPETPISFNKEFKYLSDTYPNQLTSDRLVKEFAELLVEANGNPIHIKSDHVYTVSTLGNIIFL